MDKRNQLVQISPVIVLAIMLQGRVYIFHFHCLNTHEAFFAVRPSANPIELCRMRRYKQVMRTSTKIEMTNSGAEFCMRELVNHILKELRTIFTKKLWRIFNRSG
jgi:hypothetical protein